MKLYYLTGACSFVPHTALEWIGQPYEAESVSREQLKSAEYLALNPQGAVPLLVDGDFALSQNTAILSYLDDLYPEARLFGSHTAQGKAKASRWLAFFNSDVHKAFAPLFRVPAYAEGNDTLIAQIRETAVKTLLNYFALANEHLATHEFFGENISVADVYLYTMLGWAKKLGIDVSECQHFPAFVQRVEANPGVDAVRIQEGLKK